MAAISQAPENVLESILGPELESVPTVTASETTGSPSPVGVTPPTTPAGMGSPQQKTTTTPRHGKTPKSGSKLQQQRRRTPKATAQRARDTRLPSVRTGSVFDRLYKTQTAASKAWTPARQQVRRVNVTPTKAGVDDTLNVFSRLHITSTVSNSGKKFGTGRSTNIRYTPVKEKKLSPAKTQIRTPTSTSRSGLTSYVYSPRMKPLTKLYFDSKYHPGLGVEAVEPIKLGYSFFQSFCEYESGGLDSKQIAREIIVAFFKKDFPAGRYVCKIRPVMFGQFSYSTALTYLYG